MTVVRVTGWVLRVLLAALFGLQGMIHREPQVITTLVLTVLLAIALYFEPPDKSRVTP